LHLHPLTIFMLFVVGNNQVEIYLYFDLD